MSQEIEERDYSEELVWARVDEDTKSGSYGDLEYERSKEGQWILFSLNFDEDIELDLYHQNNNTLYFHLLQRLCEGEEFKEAEDKLYKTEVENPEKFKPLLEDGRLSERYRQDISDFLEGEIWES